MKRILAVVLAALLTLSCFAFAGSAAENDAEYKKTYVVKVAPASEAKIVITSLTGSNYVIEGDTFQFTVETINGYVFDVSSGIRIADTHYEAGILDNLGNDASYILEPDADGVYTITNVTEDLYVYASSTETSMFAGLKDFLFGIFGGIFSVIIELLKFIAE